MKNKKYIIIILATLFSVSFIFNSCKKTGTDKEWENKLRGGYWIPVNEQGERNKYMPAFVFHDNSEGYSFMKNSPEDQDKFKWEIKRKQLKLFYDQAPGYTVGHDKYNSQGLFKISSVEENRISVTQFIFGGYQQDYYLQRADLNSEQENDE